MPTGPTQRDSGGGFRAGPALGHPKVRVGKMHRSVKVYVRFRNISPAAPPAQFGTFGDGTVGQRSQVLGIDGNLVSVAKYKQKTKQPVVP